MKRLSITLDPSQTWNTDMWHKMFDANRPQESLKLTFDSVTTLFHSLLHDIPCEVPAQMEGLGIILTRSSEREMIKAKICRSNRMVVFVSTMVAGIRIEIKFCNGKKIDYAMEVHFDWDTRQFLPLL